MLRRRLLAVTGSVLLSTGCFHQVVQTGRVPSATIVEKPFVSTWLWGIVPAQPIDVRQQCPMGVAVVTTEQSFMNGLVGALTLGIYSPQHVTITCASSAAALPAGVREMAVKLGATEVEEAAVVDRAVEESVRSHNPVVIRIYTEGK